METTKTQNPIQPTGRIIERYGFVNTECFAGRGVYARFSIDAVSHLTRWVNSYGNPTTRIHFHDGQHITCIDDFGAENDLTMKPLTIVKRRKDL